MLHKLPKSLVFFFARHCTISRFNYGFKSRHTFSRSFLTFFTIIYLKWIVFVQLKRTLKFILWMLYFLSVCLFNLVQNHIMNHCTELCNGSLPHFLEKLLLYRAYSHASRVPTVWKNTTLRFLLKALSLSELFSEILHVSVLQGFIKPLAIKVEQY